MNAHRQVMTVTLLASLGPTLWPTARADDADRGQKTLAAKSAKAMTAKEIHAALQAPMNPTIDQATELPISSWMEQFRQSGIPIFIDREGFNKDPRIWIWGDCSARVKIQAMPNATVEQVLRAVLAPLEVDTEEAGPLFRITYRVQDGMVRLLRVPAESRGKQEDGDIITLHAEEKLLAEVLRELHGRTGANIVLDTRQKDKAKQPVSAALSDVRLLAALRVLCDMCDLQPVSLNNVFYVTSKENAERLQKEIDRRRFGEPPAAPATGPKPVPNPMEEPTPKK